MRFGLVGCGWIVERCHAPSMARADSVEVVAVADPSPGRADLVGESSARGRRLATRTIATCSRVTTSTSSASARRRPRIARSSRRRRRAASTCCARSRSRSTSPTATRWSRPPKQAGVKLAVYHNYLWYTSTRKLRELIAEGAIGDVISTEIRGLGLRPWVGNDAYRPGWRFSIDQGGGGALMDAGLHALYLTEALHGSTPVAATSSMQYEQPGIDASALCQLQMASGGAATVEIGWQHGDGAHRRVRQRGLPQGRAGRAGRLLRLPGSRRARVQRRSARQRAVEGPLPAARSST